MQTEIRVKRLSEYAVLPTRANSTDSGVDLYSDVEIAILPGQTVVIPTGISVQIHALFESDSESEGFGREWTLDGIIKDKSGLATKGLKTNAGVIDNGYTGPVGVVITYYPSYMLWINLIHGLKSVTFLRGLVDALTPALEPYVIKRGQKIAQLVVRRVELPNVVEVDSFQETDRGENGYGSSGL